MYREISGIEGMQVIVSGGIAHEAHLEEAAAYYGVIVGKAYYEGRVDLETCLRNA